MSLDICNDIEQAILKMKQKHCQARNATVSKSSNDNNISAMQQPDEEVIFITSNDEEEENNNLPLRMEKEVMEIQNRRGNEIIIKPERSDVVIISEVQIEHINKESLIQSDTDSPNFRVVKSESQDVETIIKNVNLPAADEFRVIKRELPDNELDSSECDRANNTEVSDGNDDINKTVPKTKSLTRTKRRKKISSTSNESGSDGNSKERTKKLKKRRVIRPPSSDEEDNDNVPRSSKSRSSKRTRASPRNSSSSSTTSEDENGKEMIDKFKSTIIRLSKYHKSDDADTIVDIIQSTVSDSQYSLIIDSLRRKREQNGINTRVSTSSSRYILINFIDEVLQERQSTTESSSESTQTSSDSSEYHSDDEDYVCSDSKDEDSNDDSTKIQTRKRKNKKGMKRKDELEKLNEDLRDSFICNDLLNLKPRKRQKVNYNVDDKPSSDTDSDDYVAPKINIAQVAQDDTNDEDVEDDRSTPDNLMSEIIENTKMEVDEDQRSTPDIDLKNDPRVNTLNDVAPVLGDEEIDTDCSSGESISPKAHSSDEDEDENNPVYHFIDKKNIMSCRVVLEEMDKSEAEIYIKEMLSYMLKQSAGASTSKEVQLNITFNSESNSDVILISTVELIGNQTANKETKNKENKVPEVHAAVQSNNIQRKEEDTQNKENVNPDDTVNSSQEDVSTTQTKKNVVSDVPEKNTNIELLNNAEHATTQNKTQEIGKSIKTDNTSDDDRDPESNALMIDEDSTSSIEFIEDDAEVILIEDSQEVVQQKEKENEEPHCSNSPKKESKLSKNTNSARPKDIYSNTSTTAKNHNKLGTKSKTPSKIHMKLNMLAKYEKKVSNLAYIPCRKGFLYRCTVESCTYQNTNEEMFKYHLQSRHPIVKWAGFCNLCRKSLSRKATNFLTLIDELSHMVEFHIRKEDPESIIESHEVAGRLSSTESESSNIEDPIVPNTTFRENPLLPSVPLTFSTPPSPSFYTHPDPSISRSSNLSTPPPVYGLQNCEADVLNRARPLSLLPITHVRNNQEDNTASNEQSLTTDQSAMQSTEHDLNRDCNVEELVPESSRQENMQVNPTTENPIEKAAPRNILRVRRFSGDKLSGKETSNDSEGAVHSPSSCIRSDTSSNQSAQDAVLIDPSTSSILTTVPITTSFLSTTNQATSSTSFSNALSTIGNSSTSNAISANTSSLQDLLTRPARTMTTVQNNFPCNVSNVNQTVASTSSYTLTPVAGYYNNTNITSGIIINQNVMSTTNYVLVPTSNYSFNGNTSTFNTPVNNQPNMSSSNTNQAVTQATNHLTNSTQNNHVQDIEKSVVRLQCFRPWIKFLIDYKQNNLIPLMMTKACLRNLFKCMHQNCYGYTNNQQIFLQHLIRHKSVEQSLNLLCPYCKKSCSTPEELVNHIAEKYGYCKYYCLCCFYRTSSYYNIQEHVKMHKDAQMPKFDVDPEIPDISEELVFQEISFLGLEKIVCPIKECNFQTDTYIQFRQHFYHHGDAAFICNKCNLETTRDNIEQHFSKCFQLFNFNCCYCTSGFSSLKTMSNHLVQEHIEKVPFYIERSDTSHLQSLEGKKAYCVKKMSSKAPYV